MDLKKDKQFIGYRKQTFHFTGVSSYQPEPTQDRRALRWAIGVAVAFHAILFLIQLPETEAAPEVPGAARAAYVVQQVRFQPPKPPARQKPPKPKARKIPIPDPTPNDPEPIEVEDRLDLDLEFEDSDADVLFDDFLEGPPGPPGGADGPTGPIAQIGGNVLAPNKVHAPQPKFTEEARAARVQGVVLLQAVVDAEGQVTRVKVLKGLPMGLTESAVATVKSWKYEPATRDGEPVAVYMHLTIGFWLQ